MAAINRLTDAQVRNAKPEVREALGSRGRPLKNPTPEQLQKIPRLTREPDGAGLWLWVEPNGAKSWRFIYTFAGKPKPALSFGPYPLVSLSEARQRRDDALRLLREGKDPAQEKRAQKAAQAAQATGTWGVVAAEVVEKKRKESAAPATLKRADRLIRLAAPLHSRPLAEITPREILAVLQQCERKENYATANILRGFVGQVFRFAVATGRAESDPTRDLRGALVTPKVKHRAAIVKPAAFGELLCAIDDYATRTPAIKLALQLLPLLAVRPGELRSAEWAEIDFEAALWEIPASKTKMKRPHLVPLAPQAVAILRELKELTGYGRYLFPNILRGNGFMSENILSNALRRCGYSAEEMSAHGFRTSFSSQANESGLWHPDSIERQLGHIDRNAVRRAYSRADYWAERVRLMTWWSEYCGELKAGARAKRETVQAVQAA